MRVLRAQRLFQDRQRPLVKRLGLRVLALVDVVKLPRFDGHGNSNKRENPDGSEKEAHYL